MASCRGRYLSEGPGLSPDHHPKGPAKAEAGMPSIAINASPTPDDLNTLTNLALNHCVPSWDGLETEVDMIKIEFGLSIGSQSTSCSGPNAFCICSYDLPGMQIQVMSFGSKYGLPTTVNMLVDGRFLANLYFQPELQALDGQASRVRDFILKASHSQTFIAKYLDLLDFLIPLYEREGKAYLTIAVGCTSGHPMRAHDRNRSSWDASLRRPCPYPSILMKMPRTRKKVF